MRNILMEMTEIRRKIKFYIEYSVQAAMHTIQNFGGITNSYIFDICKTYVLLKLFMGGLLCDKN